MRNCTAILPLLMSILFNVKCSPVSQPGYENAQYVPTQHIPTLSYKPQQINFRPAVQNARPVYEGKSDGLQQYTSQPKSPPSIQTAGYAPVRQVFVPTNQGPRQVDPDFYDQVLKAQQQAALRRSQAPAPQQQIYQPQQQKYAQTQAQPQYSSKYARPQLQRLAQQQEQEEEEEEEGDYDPNPSYQFGFDVKDDQFTNYQTRKEEKDGKKITGSYSVVDADGYIRTVKYTADHKEGFKAEVSREPTDIKIKIPKPIPQYQALPRQHHQQHQQQQQAARPRPQYIQVPQQRVPQRAPDEENVVYGYQ